MKQPIAKSAVHFLQYLPIAALLGLSRLLPFDLRSGLAARILGFGTRFLPPFRNRIEEGLTRVYPDMPKSKRNAIAAEVGRNMGRTLSEILHNSEFCKLHERFHVSGPGLARLENALAHGKGALIVSAHFGQWEAIRHVLKARGMETGAVYRPNNNIWYERHFLNGILGGGTPILPKGRAGTMEMVRHIRKGGFFAILPDQYYSPGVNIPFLGHPAETTTAPAELALKYGLPLVPAFGTRQENSTDITIEFEEEIPHSTAAEMMTEFNDRLARRIHDDPGQWYWLHRRWKQR
ncbi:MAG: lysophospholipid acyltransferase family protein [Rhodobacteraceae bacterium]|nr:lysophospholipid acyltransferase family protein [Paracoccaceae bacterium]